MSGLFKGPCATRQAAGACAHSLHWPTIIAYQSSNNLADAFCKDTDPTEAQPYPVDLFIKAAKDLSGSRLQQIFDNSSNPNAAALMQTLQVQLCSSSGGDYE